MKVLVTRPTHLAKGLCDKINAMGAIAEPFPVIDIQKTPHQAAVQLAIETLATIDIAIFVSPTAVLFAMPAIQERWRDLPLILWAAIGASTAKALQNYGICFSIFRYESGWACS